MSNRVQADVWDSAMEGSTAVHVMVVLANEADDDGMNCFPGTRRIARRARVSERTVIRTIQELEADGYLRIGVRGRGAGRFSEYYLNVNRLREEAEKKRAEERAAKYQKGCHGVTFSAKRKVTLAQAKGDIGAGKGDIGAAPLFVLPVNDSLEDLLPQPLAREGRRETEIGYAVDQVCSALGVANRRKRRLLADVIALEAEKGELPPTIALAMIAAWNAQAANSHRLRVKFGLVKFFGEGVWKDQRRWHWDEELLRRQAEARVGS